MHHKALRNPANTTASILKIYHMEISLPSPPLSPIYVKKKLTSLKCVSGRCDVINPLKTTKIIWVTLDGAMQMAS